MDGFDVGVPRKISVVERQNSFDSMHAHEATKRAS